MKKTLLTLGILVLIGAGGAAYAVRTGLIPADMVPGAAVRALTAKVEAKPAAQAAPLPPLVTVARAAPAELLDRLVVSGTLVAREEVLIAPEVEGLRITDLLAEEGDRVAQGQVLARLSHETFDTQAAANAAQRARARAAIQQARSLIEQSDAGLTEAAAALERTRSLLRSGAATEATQETRVSAERSARARLQSSRDGLTFAEAELAQIEAQGRELSVKIARTEVRAPVAGLISRRTARVGAMAAGAGDPLFRLVRGGEVELEAEVPEAALQRLHEGLPARATLPGGKEIDGTVRLVSAEVDRASRLGRVRVRLGADPALRVGTFARGIIEAARTRALAVPTSAIQFDDGGRAGALVVKDGRAEARSLKLGLVSAGMAEVLAGLAEGEAVVARAGSFLRPGDAVRVAEPAATTAARTQNPESAR